jgi:hypothetical protein
VQYSIAENKWIVVRCSCSSASGSFDQFWHGRSIYSHSKNLWNQWESTRMVSNVPKWSHTGRSAWKLLFGYDWRNMWRASRVSARAATIQTLHCWHCCPCSEVWTGPTSICRWHSPAHVDDLLDSYLCFDEISDWKRLTRLQLTMDKTDFTWCTTPRRQQHPPTTYVKVGSTPVTRSTSVCDLGIFINSNLVMRTRTLWTVSRCFVSCAAFVISHSSTVDYTILYHTKL